MVPELLQDEATPQAIARAVEGLDAKRAAEDAEELREKLGPPGVAQRVAGIVEETMR